MTLTGRTRLRSTWTGKLVVQVEVKGQTHDYTGGPSNRYQIWRDARIEDLTQLPIPLAYETA